MGLCSPSISTKGSQIGVAPPPQKTFSNVWRHFWLSNLRGEVLVASNEERPGMLRNILQIIGLCPHHRIIQPKMSVVLSLRNSVLEQCLAYNRSSINTAEQISGWIQQVLIEHLLCQTLLASTKENQVLTSPSVSALIFSNVSQKHWASYGRQGDLFYQQV